MHIILSYRSKKVNQKKRPPHVDKRPTLMYNKEAVKINPLHNSNKRQVSPVAKDLKISYLLDFYGDMLTEKQRDVVELYYNEDLSLAEIASHSGITRQGVRDSIKRAESQLLDYEERLRLAGRFRRIQKRLDEITDLAKDIERINDRFGAASEIYQRTSRIITLAEEISEVE